MMNKYSKCCTVLFSIFSISGCATYFNDSSQSIIIHANPKETVVVVQSDTCHSTPCVVNLKRSNEDVDMYFINGEKRKTVKLESGKSPYFWFGNFLFPVGAPISHIIDYRYSKDTKINCYDDEVFIDMNSAESEYYRWGLPEERDHIISLQFSIPEGNFHKLNVENINSNSKGFIGLTGELDYHFSNSHYLSFATGIVFDFIIPFPAPFDPPDSVHSVSVNTAFVMFQNHYNFDTWDLGYGLSYSRYFFQENNFDIISNRTFDGAGLSFSASFRLSENVSIGANYLPTFIFFDRSIAYSYSHVIFFDLKFTLFQN